VKQGRHRYFRLADADVADMLETMMGVAARAGHLRTRPGPADPAMRHARVCYDHLAGELGVQMFDTLSRKGHIAARGGEIRLTKRGEGFVADFGIDLAALRESRRPLCKSCLDWSQRRSHLAGNLGAALLDRFYDMKWAAREHKSRTVIFTRNGEANFLRLFRAQKKPRHDGRGFRIQMYGLSSSRLLCCRRRLRSCGSFPMS
jgi:hypothetical protein